MKLLLLRHGRTPANEQRLYCGATDVPLSPGGRAELQSMAEGMRSLKQDGMLCITSGMERTDETLRVLFGAEPDIRDARLREMDFGRFEMHSYEQLRQDADYIRWITDERGVVSTPGGESRKDFHERVIAAAADIKQDALVVCHGGVIAALMQHWFPGEGRHMYQWQPVHGAGYEVVFDGEKRSFRPLGVQD